MKTYQPKAKEIERNWHLLDAKDMPLGRLSSKAAVFLIGKHKVNFSRHMDSGDFVVIKNAQKLVLTGKKALQKKYRSHSGYPGGFKEVSIKKLMETNPARVIELAVSGMLPDNRLKDKRLKRLKVVNGESNPFEEKFVQKDLKRKKNND